MERCNDLHLSTMSLILTLTMLFVFDLSFFLAALEDPCDSTTCNYYFLDQSDTNCSIYLIAANFEQQDISCQACLSFDVKNGSVCYLPYFSQEDQVPCPSLDHCEAPDSHPIVFWTNVIFGGFILLSLLWLVILLIKNYWPQNQRQEYQDL